MQYYRYSNAEVSCWYKYLLFSYNIIFWGVLSDLTKVTRLHGVDPVVLVLIVGVVMFTLGFAGCVGALRENICLLKFFCGAIVLIFFLELAVAVLAFLFQDWVRDRFKEFFEINIRSYRDDIDLQNLIDSLQKANQCCGAYGPEDWDLNVYFNCSGESYSREKCGVPFSCCVPDPAVSCSCPLIDGTVAVLRIKGGSLYLNVHSFSGKTGLLTWDWEPVKDFGQWKARAKGSGGVGSSLGILRSRVERERTRLLPEVEEISYASDSGWMGRLNF
uniref:Tetraspanin 14 n=1 Tax=Ornithorhynchus anatinus TaxID=9258 RepID=A0A6I8N2V3_ORNAN